MKLDLDVGNLALLGIASSAIHWIIARSEIAKPLWSRARGLANSLLTCPACSGFWISLGLWALGLRPLMGLPSVLDAGATAVLGVFVTPVCEAVLVWGLAASAIESPTPPQP